MLAGLLTSGRVLTHPFVIGEIALGHIRQRNVILSALSDLPHADVATETEVLMFIERHALFGRGIGYADVHLLAATRMTAGARLWTKDKRLHQVAKELGLTMGLEQGA